MLVLASQYFCFIDRVIYVIDSSPSELISFLQDYFSQALEVHQIWP